MNTKKLGRACFGLAILSTVLAGASAAHADPCTIDINVQNNSAYYIKADRLAYNCGFGWQIVNLPDLIVAPGALVTVGTGVDLLGCEGQVMQGLKLHFEYWTGNDWSLETIGPVDSDFVNNNACVDGRVYRYDLPAF